MDEEHQIIVSRFWLHMIVRRRHLSPEVLRAQMAVTNLHSFLERVVVITASAYCTNIVDSPRRPPPQQVKSRLVGSVAVLGNVTRLTAVVTSLVQLVRGKGALLGDVAVLSARVALHGASLAVLGEVVGATALVAHGTLGTELTTGLSWGRGGRRSSWGRLVLRAVSGDVAKLGTVVALGTLSRVGAVALHVANVTAQVALLGGRGLWLGTSRRLVAGLATVVAQSLLLLTVVSDVAGLTALVTRSGEHGKV